jgi:hypothetical protein
MRKHLTRNNFIGFLALAFSVVGSYFVAANTGSIDLGYVFFLLGLIPSTYLLIISGANKMLILTNIYFFCINIYGLYRHWGN